MLSSLIQDAKTNQASMLKLIKMFTPLLHGRAARLHYAFVDAVQDMIVEFIQLIYAIDLDRVSNDDGALVSYIKTAMYNSYLRLSIASAKDSNTLSYEDTIDYGATYTDPFTDPDFWRIVRDNLSETEYAVVVQNIALGYSGADIARQFGKTRQAVNKTLQRALLKLAAVLDYYRNG